MKRWWGAPSLVTQNEVFLGEFPVFLANLAQVLMSKCWDFRCAGGDFPYYLLIVRDSFWGSGCCAVTLVSWYSLVILLLLGCYFIVSRLLAGAASLTYPKHLQGLRPKLCIISDDAPQAPGTWVKEKIRAPSLDNGKERP